MTLKELNFKKSYDSDVDDILNDFYIPALSVSVAYDRLAGFFSSSSMAVAARGIAGIVMNGGRIRLICSAKLNKEDVNAILEGTAASSEIIIKNINRELEDVEMIEDRFVKSHIKGLGWMIAHGLLEIKIAVVKDGDRILPFDEAISSGLFHQKIGILKDVEGNVISFSGSDNETAYAWTKNIEEFKVFCSWHEAQNEYLESDINKFNRFWFGLGQRTEVVDLPDAVKKKWIEIAPDDFEVLELEKTYPKKKHAGIKLFDHQIQALNKWISNNKRCIFEMATGTGKTYAAIACIKHILTEDDRIVIVISTPFAHLMHQWKDSLEKLNINIETVEAFSGNTKWKDILVDRLRDVRNGILNNLVIITTHDTFYRDEFRTFLTIARCKQFLIADEVHGLGSEMRRLGLINEYDYRLGLSATPSRWLDPEGTTLILNYFGIRNDDDLFVFSLEDAIRTINPETGETYLTPYEYRPYFTELTDEEVESYIEKTKKIAKAFYQSKSYEKNTYFDLLCIERQKIIRNAQNKFNVLSDILDNIGELMFCLIYCSPEQIDLVQEILNDRQIIQHKFTQAEGTSPDKEYGGISERDFILQQFGNGQYQLLVAMKCLDEGVDVPPARVSVILASSGNPREYIQRRGRLLRRFPGKEKSIIYDVIVLPSIEPNRNFYGQLDEIEKRMVKSELRRYEEFAMTSLNVVECIKTIRAIEDKLGWG
jgi:superfamily II DNA or RNA helicase